MGVVSLKSVRTQKIIHSSRLPKDEEKDKQVVLLIIWQSRPPSLIAFRILIITIYFITFHKYTFKIKGIFRHSPWYLLKCKCS